jgi:hypothetical protein
VNPIPAVDDLGGIPLDPVLRDKEDGGGVAELAREAGAADCGREGGGGGGAAAAGSGFACFVSHVLMVSMWETHPFDNPSFEVRIENH